MSSSTFTVNVQNSTGLTLWNVCLFHWCNGHLETYYLPSMEPGVGPTATFTTYSGRTDYYYVTFGYQTSGFGMLGAVTTVSHTTCDAPDDATSMFFHLNISDYYVQYNNHSCTLHDYGETQLLTVGTDASEPQPAGSPAGDETTFNMVFTNRNSYSVQAFLLHLSIQGTPTSTWFNLGPYTTPPDVVCNNSLPGTGDLYILCFIRHGNVYLGNVQNTWNGTDDYIVFAAPVAVAGNNFSSQYSSAQFPTVTEFWTNSE